MHASFQQQQPLLCTAAVRSAPSPQHGALLDTDHLADQAFDKAQGRLALGFAQNSLAPPARR